MVPPETPSLLGNLRYVPTPWNPSLERKQLDTILIIDIKYNTKKYY